MTRFLWIQERVRLKHFMIKCIDGKQNPADLMTKALTKSEIEMNCRRLSSEEPVDEEKNNNEPLRNNNDDDEHDSSGRQQTSCGHTAPPNGLAVSPSGRFSGRAMLRSAASRRSGRSIPKVSGRV